MSVTAFPSQTLQVALPSPVSKKHRSARKKPFAITQVYSLLLQGVYEHYLVLAEQLTQRYYAAGSLLRPMRKTDEQMGPHDAALANRGEILTSSIMIVPSSSDKMPLMASSMVSSKP
jgi:hypothetical protein